MLVTPNMMLTRATDAIPQRWRHMSQGFLDMQRSGLIAGYAAACHRVGLSEKIPVADVYAEWQRRADSGVDVTAHLANGLNHPDRLAHGFAADIMWNALYIPSTSIGQRRIVLP